MNWLVVALGALALSSWLSTVLLMRAAVVKPRIGALTERALIGVIISAFGTISVVLVVNTEAGWSLVGLEIARWVFRVSLLALLLVPPSWLVLYAFDRLGDKQ